ncbi:MAG: SDR family oxidoreductase [Thermodesulfobacteriota bacterium]
MKNILITGSSGYLGIQLMKRLTGRDEVDRIVGVDIRPPAARAEKFTFYRADIRDSGLARVMADHQIDTVVHLAFVVQPIRSIQKMHDIDCNGTRNVLFAAAGAGVDHFVATSSTLAYGAHPDNPEGLHEGHPLRGNRGFPYGYYKAETDRLMQDFAERHSAMKVAILRPSTVFGPGVDNYISRMLFLPVTVAVAGGDPPVQFIHEADFVDGCLAAMSQKAAGAFNLAGDGTVTVSEIARILKTRLIRLPAKVIYPALEALWRLHAPGIEVNSGYLDYIRYPFVASNQKAKEQLGFYPRYDSRQTLEETVKGR